LTQGARARRVHREERVFGRVSKPTRRKTLALINARIHAAHESTKKILIGRTDDERGSIAARTVRIPADNHNRRAVGLAHEQTRGGGDFICDGENRGMQLFAIAVALAAQIAEDRDAGGADGDIGKAETPWAAERIAE